MKRTSIKMLNTESRFVIGPSNILSGGMRACTFKPRIFTGTGSEGVNNNVMTGFNTRNHSPKQSFCSVSKTHNLNKFYTVI